MTDLTPEEQVNVRTALRFLRTRCGTWDAMAKALHCKDSSLAHVMRRRPPSASLAIRVARLAGVPVDDVLTGKYPTPGTCPYCGHRPDAADAESNATQPAR